MKRYTYKREVFSAFKHATSSEEQYFDANEIIYGNVSREEKESSNQQRVQIEQKTPQNQVLTDLQKHTLLNDTIKVTFDKYGMNQVTTALLHAINRGYYDYFSNGNGKYRDYLKSNVSPQEIECKVNELDIVSRLYQNVRMMYDVVNSKFKISQDDVIMIDDITYKKIINFNDIMNGVFTTNGRDKYISDLGSYFAIMDDEYYLAGNLVSYQTYYFRGDTTNIYVLDANDMEINAIIYEKWTSSGKNTLAAIRIVNENKKWLIDNISILANE